MKNTMSYKDAMRAAKEEAIAEQTGKFYEMAPKSSEDIWGPVSTAPNQTVTGAAQGERFSGSGGYEYGQLPDGAFVILKSGRGAAPGTVVKPGMKGYDAIKSEFEMVKAGKPVSSKPRSVASKPAAPKAAPKSEVPKAQAAQPSAPGKFGGMGDLRRSDSQMTPTPRAKALNDYEGKTGTYLRGELFRAVKETLGQTLPTAAAHAAAEKMIMADKDFAAAEQYLASHGTFPRSLPNQPPRLRK